uniref:Protein kinase domain-containing protein n=1 Tax=Panagrolaimus davidi TaxID=227884 RepID=A0A914PNS2_9BILA
MLLKNGFIKAKKNQMFKHISRGACIGSGRDASVSLCNIRGLKQQFVIKTLNTSIDTEIHEAELQILSFMDSQFIPRLFYAGYDNLGFYSFITEYIAGGTLAYHWPNIPSKDINFIAYEVARGLAYLHDKNCSHGANIDLKLDNIALTPNGHVKLLDFGCSRDITTPQILPEQCKDYEAPEVAAKKPSGAPSDFYAFGIVILKLLQKKNPMKIHEKIGDTIADDFISKLLIANPADRLKADEIFRHEYLQNIGSEPGFCPNVISTETFEQPMESESPAAAKRKNLETFGLTEEVMRNLMKLKLFRFPSENLYNSFN